MRLLAAKRVKSLPAIIGWQGTRVFDARPVSSRALGCLQSYPNTLEHEGEPGG